MLCGAVLCKGLAQLCGALQKLSSALRCFAKAWQSLATQRRCGAQRSEAKATCGGALLRKGLARPCGALQRRSEVALCKGGALQSWAMLRPRGAKLGKGNAGQSYATAVLSTAPRGHALLRKGEALHRMAKTREGVFGKVNQRG